VRRLARGALRRRLGTGWFVAVDQGLEDAPCGALADGPVVTAQQDDELALPHIGPSRRLPKDWTGRYNTTPVLIETFVHTPRYTGAVHKASSWIPVETTQGRTRIGALNCARFRIWMFANRLPP